jgi:hypothetical protein
LQQITTLVWDLLLPSKQKCQLKQHRARIYENKFFGFVNPKSFFPHARAMLRKSELQKSGPEMESPFTKQFSLFLFHPFTPIHSHHCDNSLIIDPQRNLKPRI